jgi:hypothetical protein
MGEGSLQTLIQSKQQSRKQQMDSFFTDIEAKYENIIVLQMVMTTRVGY